MHSPPLNSISCNSGVIAIAFLIVAIVKTCSGSLSHEKWLDALILYLNQNGAAADWNCSNIVEKSDPLEILNFFFFLNFKSLEIIHVLFQWGKWGEKKTCLPAHSCYKHTYAKEPEPEKCGHSSMYVHVSSGSLFHMWHLRHEAIWCAQPHLVFLTTGVRQQRKSNLEYSRVHQHAGSYPPCSFIVGPGLTLGLVWSGLEQKSYFCDFCHQSCPCILLLGVTLRKLSPGFLALLLLILANLAPPPRVSRSSLPLAAALQGFITVAVPCFCTYSGEFGNSLLTLSEADHPVQKTGATTTHPLLGAVVL